MDPLMRAIIDICVLLFFAKLVGVGFRKVGLPENIGFIVAGFLLGPSLLGSFSLGGLQLVELNDYVRVFARLGYILLLFLVGLNISTVEFKATKAPSLAFGFLGSVSPLVLGIFLYGFMEKDLAVILIVSACLTTSSLPLVLSLSKLKVLPTGKAKTSFNAAVVDNLIGVLVLSVIVSLTERSQSPSFYTVASLIFRTLVFSFLLLSITVVSIPRLISRIGAWSVYLGRFGGVVEVLVTALCFFYAALAYASGLSPITGAIICGIAIAASRILVRVRDYINNVSFLFAPIFFVIVGASIGTSALNPILIIEGVFFLLFILGLGVVFGSVLPTFAAFRSWKAAGAIGLARFSLGNVALIIAGIALTNSAISETVYFQILLTVIATHLLSPKLINRFCGNKNESETSGVGST